MSVLDLHSRVGEALLTGSTHSTLIRFFYHDLPQGPAEGCICQLGFAGQSLKLPEVQKAFEFSKAIALPCSTCPISHISRAQTELYFCRKLGERSWSKLGRLGVRGGEPLAGALGAPRRRFAAGCFSQLAAFSCLKGWPKTCEPCLAGTSSDTQLCCDGYDPSMIRVITRNYSDGIQMVFT